MYYLAIAGEMPETPTLEDLASLIEAVHHACRAGEYDEAYPILRQDINKGDRFLLPDELGAWDTYLVLMLEFFPDGDTSCAPQISSAEDKSTLLHEIGFCMVSLGRLSEGPPFYNRAITIYKSIEKWRQASRSYSNLMELYAYLGKLDFSTDAVCEELKLARIIEDKNQEIIALSDQALVTSLRGDLELAGKAFRQAEELQRNIQPQVRHLSRLEGIKHADYLRRSGNAAYAQRITALNLKVCVNNGWRNNISRCHRVLGDLDSGSGQFESAHTHYDKALKIARNIVSRVVLIEVLLSRGRWFARYKHDASSAFNDLNEALDYTVNSGYRIYETDIRIALAWAYLAKASVPHISSENKNAALANAWTQADRAQRMSRRMGYYWGQVDAEKVMRKLEEMEEELQE